jgi:hypothetical protein
MDLTLDDLKQRWQEMDRRLDRSLRLNARLVRESALDKAATALRRLTRLLWIELVVDFGIALWLGSFIADHLTEVRFLLPAAGLQLGIILLAVSAIRQLAAIASLDYDATILHIQKRLESLRIERLRTMRWSLLTGPLIWVPVLIVVLKGLVGLDAYAMFTLEWVVGNILFGAAVIPVAIWVSRRYADRLRQSPLAQGLLRDMAGFNLNAALGFLGSLERFEKEEQP